jgi:hypothetical protein
VRLTPSAEQQLQDADIQKQEESGRRPPRLGVCGTAVAEGEEGSGSCPSRDGGRRRHLTAYAVDIIVISTSARGSEARIELQPPTPGALQAVKAIPRREWHPRRRCWTIPKRLVPVAAQSFCDLGFRVCVGRGDPAPGASQPVPGPGGLDASAPVEPGLPRPSRGARSSSGRRRPVVSIVGAGLRGGTGATSGGKLSLRHTVMVSSDGLRGSVRRPTP